MRSRAPRTAAIAAAAAGLLLATVQAAATSAWPMYHLDPAHTGNDGGEPSFAHLGRAWTQSGLDAGVYAEPLVSGGNVIAASENNTVYAFDTASGAMRWQVHLGTPRTHNFPCGDINPLGITGTPVIDGGFLYVLAEIENSPTSFSFHLVKIDPTSGAIGYDHDVTPAGMDPNVQQERSALAVSNGDVVVVWGGLSGDCGNYHGWVETVSEASGSPTAVWHSTPNGREGSIWAPSGAAVDGSGNIYVATGNSSSNSLSNYDYGNSVLRFAPGLSSLSFFAPGAPVNWVSLNSTDTDLGSVGPSLLPNGLLFSIGKGGRGYLLNQASLPNNSNPGGGENASAQVCHASSDAAFGGLAVSGSLVLVPCADGIAAVNIDSANAFHVVWYTGHGGGPPIVAGGLVWTGAMFGGSTVYGYDMSGNLVAQLPLPAATEHFATPAAGDSMLFAAAGNALVAFVPLSPAAAGYVLDSWGAVHPFGGAPARTDGPWWPGWDIARGIALRPDRISGYVLDGWGHVHPFGGAPTPADGPFWAGWDIARGVALNPCDSSGNSGYVLDGWGTVHPFGGAPAVTGEAFYFNWDVVRAIAINPCSGGIVSGYTIDAFGGVHAFWQMNTSRVSDPTDEAYWGGWPIARGIAVTSRGAGYTLDAFGGLHAFGGAAAVTQTATFSGQYIARGVSFSAALGGGYVLDGFGGLHPWWTSGSAPLGVPTDGPTWTSQVARGVAQ